MWWLISGVSRRKLPWWFLASSETRNEALKKSPAPQLQGRQAVGQIKDKSDGDIRNMNHILVTTDTQNRESINKSDTQSRLHTASCLLRLLTSLTSLIHIQVFKKFSQDKWQRTTVPKRLGGAAIVRTFVRNLQKKMWRGKQISESSAKHWQTVSFGEERWSPVEALTHTDTQTKPFQKWEEKKKKIQPSKYPWTWNLI